MKPRLFWPLAFGLLACSQTVVIAPAPGDAGRPTLDAGRAETDLGTPDAGAAPPPPVALDVLFVVDNSPSMEEEQVSLAEAIPGLVSALATGRVLDVDTGALVRDFPPVTSLQMGVVSADMGSGRERVPTCEGLGDDGVLSTQGAMDATPRCAASYPSFLAFEAGADGSGEEPEALAGRLAADVACVAQLGTEGCGFEQPLEAMLKALTPASSELRFFEGTRGNGAGGPNDGFLRDDAALGIVLLTDEDDCSARDTDVYNPSSINYRGDLNLRCLNHPEALHDVGRFVDGLLAIEPAARIAFTAIAGLPARLAPRPGEPANYRRMLNAPRMQERIDPDNPNALVASCDASERGLAYPPRRVVTLARDLEARGAKATVQSICTRSFSAAIADVALRLAATLES
ncbi:MAG: hypothetical protein AAGH15_27465 [Myxococcota bacterium]